MGVASSKNSKLRDCDIRSAIKVQLVPRLTGTTPSRVIEELGLNAGTIRIDLAVANGKLHGFEIKSEADTLVRLNAQAQIYSKVFDRMTLICGKNHAARVEKTVPLWWGIMIARKENGNLILKTIRKPKHNPQLDSAALVKLLWKDELIRFLQPKFEGKTLKNLSKGSLWDHAIATFSVAEIRRIVRETLKTRQGWRFDPLPT